MNFKIILKYCVTGFLLVGGVVFSVQYAKSQQPAQTVPSVKKDFKMMGQERARVTIVEYSDFQCPACAGASVAVKQIVEANPQGVNFVFRHFPLRSHPISMIAHQAAECSGEQGKFWEFHDYLYQQQREWAGRPNHGEIFLQKAKEIGLDLEKFANCLADETVTERIGAEKAVGVSREVKATPTFFIEDKRFVGKVELETSGRQWIEELLEKTD